VTTWIVLRAAGIGAYVMLFLSIAWGLASTTSAFGKRISKASATTVHQFMSTCGLVLLGVHLGGLLIDSFTPFSIADVTIPMSSSYRPVAVTLGVVAMYAVVFVIVLSWMRKRIGTVWWRRSHLLAVPTFLLSMLHGIFAGSDTARPAMWWTYVGTGLVLVFLLVVRGLTAGFRPERGARPERAGPPARGARPERAPRPAAAGSPAARGSSGPELPSPPAAAADAVPA
jgi:predicted ferric reductase